MNYVDSINEGLMKAIKTKENKERAAAATHEWKMIHKSKYTGNLPDARCAWVCASSSSSSWSCGRICISITVSYVRMHINVSICEYIQLPKRTQNTQSQTQAHMNAEFDTKIATNFNGFCVSLRDDPFAIPKNWCIRRKDTQLTTMYDIDGSVEQPNGFHTTHRWHSLSLSPNTNRFISIGILCVEYIRSFRRLFSFGPQL